ncbi:MAG TPA: diaminopimelate decarboxylase [Ktedonobacterales bacterium]|jgi:diaminopimelate decarboxylase|nr:diaminopimelate decarboxylase [Ktedonobacterales bacterium]
MPEHTTRTAEAPPPHAHLWPLTARVGPDGHLRLCGLDVALLAREHGTPLYLYDEETIRAHCRAFRRAFEARWPRTAVAYAGKAYLSLALCRILREEGLELDAVSAGEAGVALAAGYPPAQIHLHGNVKPDAELEVALGAGVGRIVVDSLDELARLEQLARTRRQRVAIWLRLCPDVPTETHTYIQTGHATSKFGMTSDALIEASRRALASPWLDLVGLHAHVGSQLFDMAPLIRVVTILGETAAELRDMGADIREISPGGGLGVAYTAEQRAPEIEQYADAVTGVLLEVCERRDLAPPRLIVEPGRALVARAGVALYTVGPRKVTPGGASLVAVDGGLGDNPRPALYQARYSAGLAERMGEPAAETVSVVGRYCESGDVLIADAPLPRTCAGDILAVPVSGAYQLPMASNYNMVFRPPVVFVRDGWARLVRRRETLEDLLRLELGED